MKRVQFILALGVVAATAALVSGLWVLTRDRGGGSSRKQPTMSKAEDMPDAATPASAGPPPPAVGDLQSDVSQAEASRPLHDESRGQLADTSAGEQSAETQEAVLSMLRKLLSSPVDVRALMDWIQKGDDKRVAWALAVLADRSAADPDPAIRRACLCGLSAMTDRAPAAFDVLACSLLADPDMSLRRLAASFLGSGTDRQLDILFLAVDNDQGEEGPGRAVAQAAIGAIGSIGGVRAGAMLRDIWADPRLRRDCEEQLVSTAGESGDPANMDLVVQVLEGNNESLRDNAVYALGQLAHLNPNRPDVINRTLDMLRGCLTDANPHVRRNAVSALAGCGTEQDVVRLQALLEDPYIENLSYSENGQEKTRQVYVIRDRAREAIGKIEARAASKSSR